MLLTTQSLVCHQAYHHKLHLVSTALLPVSIELHYQQITLLQSLSARVWYHKV